MELGSLKAKWAARVVNKKQTKYVQTARPPCPDAVASGLPALRVLLSDPNSFFSAFSVRSTDP
jgi:hypothetical protein